MVNEYTNLKRAHRVAKYYQKMQKKLNLESAIEIRDEKGRRKKSETYTRNSQQR